MSFAASARILAGLVMRRFGWSPDTFWSATPDDVAMLIAAHDADRPATPPDAATRASLMEQFPDA